MDESVLRQKQQFENAVPAPAPGDLDQINSSLEALAHRLNQVHARLSYLYGADIEKTSVRPNPAGRIPQISTMIEDISDLVGAIETTVNRL
jgi:hypothetical protein